MRRWLKVGGHSSASTIAATAKAAIETATAATTCARRPFLPVSHPSSLVLSLLLLSSSSALSGPTFARICAAVSGAVAIHALTKSQPQLHFCKSGRLGSVYGRRPLRRAKAKPKLTRPP